MRDFAFIFEEGGVAVDWSAAVTGIHNVKQKLINNLMTDIGTDEIVADRGTSLLKEITGGGVYDLRSAQHALNFASLAAKRAVRTHEPPNAAAADKVKEFSVLLDSVQQRDVVTQLAISNGAGESIGAFQTIR